MSADARRDPRYRTSLPAVVDGPRGALRGTCTNLSLGGLFFEGPTLPLGATASMTLDLGPRGRLRLHGQVRHHASNGMGLQFTRFDPGQAEALQRLVSALAK